jgi:hypothetical protein
VRGVSITVACGAEKPLLRPRRPLSHCNRRCFHRCAVLCGAVARGGVRGRACAHVSATGRSIVFCVARRLALWTVIPAPPRLCRRCPALLHICTSACSVPCVCDVRCRRRVGRSGGAARRC